MRTAKLSYLLVGIQLAGMILAVWPGDWAWEKGFLLIDIGIGLGGWVLWHNRPGNFSIFPEPIAAAQLITTGPYRRIRHPMYTALLFAVCGIAFVQNHWYNLLGLALVVIAVLNKIPREEAYLTDKFDGYADYCRTTYRLMPGIY